MQLGVEPGATQSGYGSSLGIREGGRVSYYPAVPTMRVDAFIPSLKKWYLPQEAASHYRCQWEETNYAVERYRRYLATDQAGDFHYDLYGRLLTRGWLVYDWRQSRPRTSDGSLLHKTNAYHNLVSGLIVSSDAKGQHHFRVTIGGREILVSERDYDELPEEERGPIRYYRHERPRLAEVEVYALGQNVVQLTQSEIGRRARAAVEELLEAPVYLELWVKVRPDWRNKERDLKEFGYI